MSKCLVCEGRSQLFLCVTHITILRDTLRDLPWWLDRLHEMATGQVRLGDGGRRGTKARELDEYTGPNAADKLAKGLRENHFTVDKLLATGRVNAKASRLHDQAANELGTWVRHLCETRGLQPPEASAKDCARWLEKNTHAIASDQAAKQLHNTIIDLTDRIRRTVNRAEPPQFCGPCTTELTDEQRTKIVESGQEDRAHCRTQLYSKRGDSRVTCPTCKTEHDIAELQQLMLDEADEYSFSISDLSDFILPKLGIEASRKKLQRMALKGELGPAGEMSGIRRYQLAVVREAVRKRRTAQR